MNEAEKTVIKEICEACSNDRSRLMDIVIEVQKELGHVSGEAMELIAEETVCHRVDVESVVSFYAFLTDKPKGKTVVRLCNDIIDRLYGFDKVAQVFTEELGIDFNETTADGAVTLEGTPCIGMCDQAPAALVNDVVVTKLNSDSARELARRIKEGVKPEELVEKTGDGNNSRPLINAMVENNIRMRGPVLFADFTRGDALTKGIKMSPMEVIRQIKTARLRGRGGAGFPTGMKWEFTRAADGMRKYIVCNADEGEPGTFKDRVLLTECPHLMFEGMTMAGYAIGAERGILYLRGEYAYLKPWLENVLKERREGNLLGRNILDKDGFHFDIRIQLGAGAYVCGEETALLSSCEGHRGDPKNRPPFPAQKGYKGFPTVVNNVETFCCVSRIVDKGAAWFAQLGSQGSAGTKLLSISGNCKMPGVYEVPFGLKVSEMLHMCGANDAYAVQIGGPSGQMIGKKDFERTICYDDIATGGSVMVFDSRTSALSVAHAFMEFFVEESCGYCTPCRVGNVLLKERLEKILEGRGELEDIEYMQSLGETIKKASRCGLGQTSPNPVLSTLANFHEEYEKLLKKPEAGFKHSFNINAALQTASSIAGRKSVHFTD